jgi:putative cell wall-binding protein
VGTRGRTAAENRCLTTGLNGGPVHLAQWWTTSPAVDWNVACPGHALAAPSVALSWPAAWPAYSPLGGTSATMVGGPSRRQTWQLSVRDACTGAWVGSTGGVTSDRIVARWNGRRSNGSAAPAGVYRITLRTGTRTPPTGPAYAALHEVFADGSARAGGCRTTRTSGGTLYATAVATGRAAFPASRTVVLASGETDHLVDAATSAPYARALHAPLLLTPSGTLPGVVSDDLRRRGATSVIIVGDASAVGQGVADALRGMGIRVTRIAGSDRYATAALLATRIGGAKKQIIVASGENGRITDALLAGGPAAGLGVPILLTTRTALPGATATALSRLGAARAQVTIVGPVAAVSSEVQHALGTRARSVRRISGSGDVGTAAALTASYAGRLGSGAVVVVAAGRGADLLAAGALGRPILLTQRQSLPAPSGAWLKNHPRTPVRVIGHPAVVAPTVLAAIGR